MYCANCGVKLADTEQVCPLCGVTAYHPEIQRGKAEPMYPAQRYPEQVSAVGKMIIVTAAFLLPMIITFLCDLQISGRVSWSGYVIGALGLIYVCLVLPFWFQSPNPVIFVPCGFAAAAGYVLYIDLITAGGWFLSFAFPVIGFLCLVVTAVVTLLRYLRRGRLYIIGGAAVALGLFMPVMEFLLCLTFENLQFAVWSFYPLAALVLLGGTLIFLGISRPARESMERKFFI